MYLYANNVSTALGDLACEVLVVIESVDLLIWGQEITSEANAHLGYLAYSLGIAHRRRLAQYIQ